MNASRTLGLAWLVSAATSTAACTRNQDEPHDPRLDSIEQRISQEQAKLTAIQKQVSDAEAQAAAARTEAAFQACRAQVTEIRAEAERQRAMCAKEVADHNLCLVRNSERAANTSLAGCGVGIAYSLLSGGAAAPWALGGCAVGMGAGALSEDQCPAITCGESLADLEAAVLSDRHLSEMPRCGGHAGIELAAGQSIAARGLVVKRVIPGTYADTANMAAGDVLIKVGLTPIGSAEALASALADKREGQPLRVSVVRNGERFELTAAATRRTGNGEQARTVRLGVELGEPVKNIPYRAGVVVRSVAPDSPAAASGLRRGDAIEGLSLLPNDREPRRDQEVHRLADAEGFLGETRASDEILFKVTRAGDPTEVRLRLGDRSGRAEL